MKYYRIQFTPKTIGIINEHRIPHIILCCKKDNIGNCCISEEYASFAILCGITLTEFTKEFNFGIENHLFEFIW